MRYAQYHKTLTLHIFIPASTPSRSPLRFASTVLPPSCASVHRSLIATPSAIPPPCHSPPSGGDNSQSTPFSRTIAKFNRPTNTIIVFDLPVRVRVVPFGPNGALDTMKAHSGSVSLGTDSGSSRPQSQDGGRRNSRTFLDERMPSSGSAFHACPGRGH